MRYYETRFEAAERLSRSMLDSDWKWRDIEEYWSQLNYDEFFINKLRMTIFDEDGKIKNKETK